MNIFSRLIAFIKGVVRRMIRYEDVESVEHIESPLSTDMVNALDAWYQMYTNQPSYLSEEVSTLGLPSLICHELARQITLELKWNITGTKRDENAEALTNPRSEFLKAEFEKCMTKLRERLEQGCAAGGMIIKPYLKGEHLYFDWTMDWSIYPIAFDDEGNLSDVVFRDSYTQGKSFYTRLERHTRAGNDVKITQRAFKSSTRESIGSEVSLTEVPLWAEAQPELLVKNVDGQMFGWFRVAAANNVDPESPMGLSVFSKAMDLIEDADRQYSRLLWEFEASEMAIDVDPQVLRPSGQNRDGSTRYEMPKLNKRLFRGVDMGQDETYNVFAPTIRDASLLNGLNQILMRVEDQAGLSRGTLSDANAEARTATELRIIRQRSYATIADNQKALETCLRDVIRVMDKYTSLYQLAPEGDYEVSFEWDDSVITDTEQQMNERLTLMNAGVMSKTELREWYFGETKAQATAAIDAITAEQVAEMAQMLPTVQE